MQRHTSKRGTRKKTTRIQSRKATSLRAKYITNYQSPEGVVKTILDKIINLSIRQSTINKIDNQLKSYCFKYIQNQIEYLFEEKYINYSRSNNNTDTLFWKNKIPVENQWIEIKEPKTLPSDRFEGAFTRTKELETKNKTLPIHQIKEGLENDILLNDTNENEVIEEENEKTENNKQMKKKLILPEKTEKKNNDKEEEKTLNKNKIQIPQTNINKPNKKIQMINFPSLDIPDIEKEFIHEEYDPPNIDKLRKEIEEEIKKKEREKKLQIDALKLAKKKEDSEKINKKIKPLDSNKYTFDSNGQIMSFKQYKLDNLTKDFTFIKNSIKEHDRIRPLKKKKISIKKNQIIKITEEVIKNPNNEEEINNDKSLTEKIKDKKDRVIPSGSNFQIILPNIGVVIKENQKIKEGGREFNKYFNKYSIHDYDKILNEYVPLQNKTQMRSKMEKLNLTTSNNLKKKMSESVDNTRTNASQNNFNNINKTIIYNNNLNTNNPLLSTNDNIQITINDPENNIVNSSPYLKTSINSFNTNTNNYNPLMTSLNFKSTFINYSQGKKGINFNSSITMKKPGSTSLKLEIESMRDLKNDRVYYESQNIKQKNIFGKNFMKNYKIALIKPPGNNSLSPFNKTILTDTNWGNQIEEKGKQKENIVFARHHTKQQALRELGSNILSGIKIKLPRDRKVEINK